MPSIIQSLEIFIEFNALTLDREIKQADKYMGKHTYMQVYFKIEMMLLLKYFRLMIGITGFCLN